MRIGLLGKKIGMTRVYDDKGRATAVTVIDVSDNTRLDVKTVEKDGYSGVQLGFDTQKESRVNKAELGLFKKAGSAPKKFVAEFRLEDNETVGDDLNLKPTLFQPGQLVDVIGQSKGKGFQGVMKKHNMSGQPMSHGPHDASPQRCDRQPLHARPRLEKHGHARSHGRRARDGAKFESFTSARI